MKFTYANSDGLFDILHMHKIFVGAARSIFPGVLSEIAEPMSNILQKHHV